MVAVAVGGVVGVVVGVAVVVVVGGVVAVAVVVGVGVVVVLTKLNKPRLQQRQRPRRKLTNQKKILQRRMR